MFTTAVFELRGLCAHTGATKALFYKGEPLGVIKCRACLEEIDCDHESVKVSQESFDYAGTHANGGQAGTEHWLSAVCLDCQSDVTESYDFTSHEGEE